MTENHMVTKNPKGSKTIRSITPGSTFYRRNVVMLKPTTCSSPSLAAEPKSYPSEELPSSPIAAVHQSIISKYLLLRSGQQRPFPGRSASNGSSMENSWLERLWESAIEASDDGVPSPTRCTAALGVFFQLVSQAEGTLQEMGRKAFQELCRCIFVDFDQVADELSDLSWFDNHRNSETVCQKRMEVLADLKHYFHLETVEASATKRSTSRTSTPSLPALRTTVSRGSEEEAPKPLTDIFSRPGTEENRPSSECRGPSLLVSNVLSMAFQVSPQGKRRNLGANEMRVNWRKLNDYLRRNGNDQMKATIVRGWRTFIQDLKRRRDVAIQRGRNTDRVLLSRAWFVWRLYMQDQKRLHGTDMQSIMETVRFRLRAMKVQQDRLQMEKFQLEDRIQQMKESKYIMDFSRMLKDREGGTMRDGVIQFRELSPVEKQQQQLEISMVEEAAPIRTRSMESFSTNTVPEEEDEDDFVVGVAFEGSSNRNSTVDIGALIQNKVALQSENRALQLRPLVAEERSSTLPLYHFEVMSVAQYQTRLLGNVPRTDAFITWMNGKLKEVNYQGLEMQNYGQSLVSGEIYLAVLLTIVPMHLWAFPSVGLAKLSDQERCEMAVELLLRMKLIEKGEFTVQSILNQREEVNQLVVAKLFVYERLRLLSRKLRLASAIASVQADEKPDPLGLMSDAYKDNYSSEDNGMKFNRLKRKGYGDTELAMSVPEWRIVNDQSLGIRLVATHESRAVGTQTGITAVEMAGLEESVPQLMQKLTHKRDEKLRSHMQLLQKALSNL
eukprot:GGOE01001403.1.p1 GENE.GGOE01001403.1~~GGOE01001403.1.p1  ORF type:complete len:782 (-),score=237.16 GGOE01001403.1:267-2612(-)